MERLWSPWRMSYISGEKKDEGCIFCIKPKENIDRDNLILHRGKFSFAIMNLYPYNNGHMMFVPYRHINDITLLSDDEAMEIMDMLRYFTHISRKLMNPEGFNSGFNLGKIAGAGIAEHIHCHLVPRWQGDTNFMSVIGNTRVIPEDIFQTYDKIIKTMVAEGGL